MAGQHGMAWNLVLVSSSVNVKTCKVEVVQNVVLFDLTEVLL